MIHCISLLRGINVSGHNVIKMAELKALFENLGFQQVQTYIQSGNILFDFEQTEVSYLETLIAEAIKAKFGFDVPVLVLTADELNAIYKSNPLLNENADISTLHVTLLSEKPAVDLVKAIEIDAYLPDRFMIVDKCVYLSCPNGYGRTKLNNTFFESKLRVKATTRNWKTIGKVIELTKQAKQIL